MNSNNTIGKTYDIINWHDDDIDENDLVSFDIIIKKHLKIFQYLEKKD
jgi:hypothetical protein